MAGTRAGHAALSLVASPACQHKVVAGKMLPVGSVRRSAFRCVVVDRRVEIQSGIPREQRAFGRAPGAIHTAPSEEIIDNVDLGRGVTDASKSHETADPKLYARGAISEAPTLPARKE